jgi:beta-phosphoglucomutase
MPAAEIGAAIWDVDGTLVDTAEMHFEAWTELCRQLGRPFTREEFAATFGRRNAEILPVLFGDRFSGRELDDLGLQKEELYRGAARRGVELLPGARSLMEGLKAAGFRQAVGSSAPRANVELILEITRSTHLFDAVSCAEDTTRGKPDPEVFLVAARKLDAPPRRCVVFEDAVAGVEAARNGGMKCVAVRFVGHHPEAKLKAAGADLVVPTLDDVSVQTVRDLLDG